MTGIANEHAPDEQDRKAVVENLRCIGLSAYLCRISIVRSGASSQRMGLKCADALNTNSNLIPPPHPGKADWHVPIGCPAWFSLHPAIIDDLLAQFSQLPARRERRLGV